MADIRIDSEIEMRPLNSIRPYTRNPRINGPTIRLLMKLIPKVGFNVPIVVDKKGIIVKGHARYIAAIRLGMTEVPCIVTHADEDAIKADRIADNRISEYSEWIVAGLLDEINEMEFDLSDLGLPKISLDDVADADTLEEQIADSANDEETIEEEEDEDYLAGYDDPELISEIMKVLEAPHYSVTCERCGYHMIIPVDELEDYKE